MAAKPIRQVVEVTTGDSEANLRDIEKAATDAGRKVEELDRQEVDVDVSEIKVDTAAALRRLGELKEEARRLADEKVAIKAELDAAGFAGDVSKVKAELDSIDRNIEVGLDLDEGRVNTTTTAVNDVFSEIGVAGSDVAIGISQAFNDAAEQAKNAFGPDSGISKALTAIGPIGTAALGAGVGGLLYWWQQNKAQSEAYAQDVRDIIGLLEEANGKLEEASLRRAIEGLDEEAVTAADALGLSFVDLARIIRGEAVPAYEEAKRAQQEYRDVVAKGLPGDLAVDVLRESLGLTEEQARAIQNQALQVETLNATLESEEGKLRKAAAAYDARNAIVDRTIAQVGGYKAAVEDLPEEVVTALEPYLDPAELERVRTALDEAAAPRTATVTPEFSGPIAPGYAPPSLRVELATVTPVDLVAAGRVIDRALRDFYRASGLGDWRAV